MSQKGKKLIAARDALSAFFEDLVQETVPEGESEANLDKSSLHLVHPAPQPAVAPAQRPTADKPDLSLYERMPVVEDEPEPPPVEEEPVVEASTPEPEVAEADEPEVESQPALGKPAWADAPFQAMLFKVGGLTLAVPLVDLNGVVEWDSEAVTEMPGHSDFYLGLIKHIDRNVPVVDTARLVLPPDKLSALAGDDPYERIQRVVLIADSGYGLGCDDVNEVITLSPDAVRWRGVRSSRPWLAGTVIEHMCALIDASAFARMLAERRSVQDFHA